MIILPTLSQVLNWFQDLFHFCLVSFSTILCVTPQIHRHTHTNSPHSPPTHPLPVCVCHCWNLVYVFVCFCHELTLILDISNNIVLCIYNKYCPTPFYIVYEFNLFSFYTLCNLTLLCFYFFYLVKISPKMSRKVALPEVPESVKMLQNILKEKLLLEGSFTLQYEDADFDNAVCNLTDIHDLPPECAILHILWDETTPLVQQESDSVGSESSLDTASLSSRESLPSPSAFIRNYMCLKVAFTIFLPWPRPDWVSCLCSCQLTPLP